LPMADNMGRTRDDSDLYDLVDDLAAGTRDAYPESLCKVGCSACCTYPAGLFTATQKEWEVISDHIDRHWDAEQVLAFVGRFWASHGRYFQRLRAIEWLMEFPLPIHPKREAVPLSCPFLHDDRCAVYPVRPVYCRTFGLFSYKYWWRREHFIYACDMQSDQLEPLTRQAGRPQLPNLDPILARRHVLSKGGKRRLLALWVASRWPKRWWKEQLRRAVHVGQDGLPEPAGRGEESDTRRSLAGRPRPADDSAAAQRRAAVDS